MSNEFGSLLRQYRNIKGLSQSQLLKELREEGHELYSKGTVSKWEKGKNKPKIGVVEDLEGILALPKGTLLKAAGYLVEIESAQQNQAVANLVIKQLNKKEHSKQLADIASMLLSHGLNNLTIAQPAENQKDNPNWIEYFKKYPYRIYDYNSDSILLGNQKQLALEIKQNMEAVCNKYSKYNLDCFLSHLKAEPKIEGKEFLEVLDKNPLQLIEILKLIVQKKTFKGTCPVCKDW